jgi:hypothetical protein
LRKLLIFQLTFSVRSEKKMRPVWIATCVLSTLTYSSLLDAKQAVAIDPLYGSDLGSSNQTVNVPSMDVLTGTQSIIPNIVPPMVQSVEFSPREPLPTRSHSAISDVSPAASSSFVPSSSTSHSSLARSNADSFSPVSRHPFNPTTGSYMAQPVAPGSAQSTTLDQIRRLQEQLRSYQVAPDEWDGSTISPAVTISNPSAFGADRNRLFAGASFQARTRYSGGGVFGRLFDRNAGGVPDGSAGIGIGLGDASDSIGLQVSYTAASFGGSRALGSGGINAKVHARFADGWAFALGGDGIVNFGRLPEGSPTAFNDFENTYYGVASRVFPLRSNINDPFSRVTLTAGLGSGRFRSLGQVNRRAFGINPFGSVAVRATPNLSLISEWTGQDLAMGLSFVPFRNIPLIITPAVRDIAGRGVGGPRFVMGVGGSLGDIFSVLDWIL